MGTVHAPAGVRRDERGIALITVLLVGFAVSAIALTGAFWILNSSLIQKNGERAAMLNDVAVSAAEEGRSKLNATPAVYPAAGYVQLDTNAVVKDGAGVVMPGVRKNTYAGPDGITSGQFGVFGTVIAVVTDSFGNKAVRRLQVNQESFAKYAYFTTIEGNIVFANNDQIRGPVHSNDQIKIDNSGATFFDQVSTAASSIQGQSNGTFVNFPPRLSVPPIALPTTQAFTALQTRATNGGVSFVGNTNGNAEGESSVRIEFVSVDINADGDSTDANEGFMRIYQDNAGRGTCPEPCPVTPDRTTTSVSRPTVVCPSSGRAGTGFRPGSRRTTRPGMVRPAQISSDSGLPRIPLVTPAARPALR